VLIKIQTDCTYHFGIEECQDETSVHCIRDHIMYLKDNNRYFAIVLSSSRHPYSCTCKIDDFDYRTYSPISKSHKKIALFLSKIFDVYSARVTIYVCLQTVLFTLHRACPLKSERSPILNTCVVDTGLPRCSRGLRS
jgi:hypothetical protein